MQADPDASVHVTQGVTTVFVTVIAADAITDLCKVSKCHAELCDLLLMLS